MAATADEYKIKKGDTLERIARANKIKDWKKLWGHKDNKKLNAKRKGNEEKIEPGDVIKIPFDLMPAAVRKKKEEEAAAKDPKKKKEEDKLLVTFKGKTYSFTKKEYEEFKKKLLAILKRGPVLGLKQRVGSARVLYDHFKSQNDDQYIVSWLIEATRGADLPPESLIAKAETAMKALESAVGSGDLKKVEAAMKAADKPINTAIETMRKYREEMISGAGNWVTGLEITKTVSFTIVSICAAPVAASAGAGTLAAGAIASGGAALLESTATEAGVAIAGSKDQTAEGALWNITKKTLLAAGVGAVLKGKGADKVINKVGESIVKNAGKGAFKKFVTSDKLYATLIKKYLTNAGTSGLEAAMEESVKLMTDPKAKPDEFFSTVAKKMVLGGFVKELDDVVEKAFAPALIKKMKPADYKSFFGTMKPEHAAKVFEGFITKSYGAAIEKSFDGVINSMSGKESPKVLVEKAAEKFAMGPSMKKALEEFDKKHGSKIKK